MSNHFGFINRLFRRNDPAEEQLLREVEKRGGIEVVLEAWRTNQTLSENSVSPRSSLQVSAVWACVRLISETVGSLPLFIYQESNAEKNRAKDHYLYPILHDQPNPAMTAIEMRETMQSHLVLWGNAYAQIIYDDRGRVKEIWPLRPDKMLEVSLINGVKYYKYQLENGSVQTFDDSTIWHIPGLGSFGVIGYSPIALARRGIGLAMDAEEFGARFFTNDARPGIVLEHPASLSDAAYNHLQESLEEEHKGVKKSHKPMILEEGMKLHEVGIPPEDAQYIETRKFQVREIARIMRVPPHLIGDLDQATFSNIEHQSIEFVVHTIRPWLVRWEQSINMHLLLPSERGRFYAEHLVDGLLRGDTLSRYQSYGVGKQWGFLSTNDIRRDENLNPVDGGDVYWMPLNYTNQANVGQTQPGARSLPILPEVEDGFGNDEITRRATASGEILFRDLMTRVIKREVQDLKALAKKNLASDDPEKFLERVRSFYASHMDWVNKQILPLFQGIRTFTGADESKTLLFCVSFCDRYQEKALEEIEHWATGEGCQAENRLAAFEDYLDGWNESRVKFKIGLDGQFSIID